MSARKEKEVAAEGRPSVFTKQQLLTASKYKEKRDLLEALLENDKTYSFREVDEAIDMYMKGQVK